jgi:hypothetical protein
MVTDLNGGLIWARVYGGPDIDIFLSCAVAPDNGDIIATGGTRSFTIDGNTDLWLTRVFQANGLPITPGMPVTYGGDGNDIGWSVLVCTNGDVAVAGGTASAGGFGEGYLLRTTNMLLPLCDRTYGGANSVPGEWDEFLELKEVDASKFVVTGLFFNPTFGFGDFDMFVGEFGPCFDKISGVVHGGPRNDQGWSVAVAQGAPSPQYLVGGLTESFTSSMDMYLVRQLANGTSACSTRVIETRSTVPHFPAVSVKAVTARVNANCEVTVRPRAEYTEYLICSDCNRHNLRTPRGGEENLDPNVEAPTIGMGGRHEAPPAATTMSTPGTMNYNR